MRSSGTEKYGNFYWCIKTDLSEDGDIYVMADKVTVFPDGGLAFMKANSEVEQITLAFAPGHWKCFFAASMMDGGAVAVERWKGEVVR